MKKTLIALIALGGLAQAEVVLSQDFTKLNGYSQAWTDTKGNEDPSDDVEYTSVLPDGWSTGQWNGDNTPHYAFNSTNGAVVNYPWKQNFLYTTVDLSSQADATITFTLYNGVEDTGNMFFLSSENYSIVMGNSYTSNSEIYVGTWDGSIPDGGKFVNFQKDNMPVVLGNSSNYNVAGNITYTLTMADGNMEVSAVCSSGSSWSYTVEGMEDVTFTSLGFINDGAQGGAGVKNVSLTIPEPATATLSLLALAGLAARRRRK